MHLAPFAGFVRIAIALAGLINIYLGYRFFCDVPFADARTGRGRILANMGSGALLALVGVAMLTADVRTLHHGSQNPQTAAPNNPIRHGAPASCGSAPDTGVCNRGDSAWRKA